MWKQRLMLALFLLSIISCVQEKKPGQTEEHATITPATKEDKGANALKFINAYVENENKMKHAVSMVDWVNASDLATANFKSELKELVRQAFEEHPELGLEADPIFDAQDYPEKGLTIESFDEQTNYLILKGIDWPTFKLTMKVVEQDGRWLVDGCGVINIPLERRAKR